MFTRQHYKAIAGVLRVRRPKDPQGTWFDQVRYEGLCTMHQAIVSELVDMFIRDNPRFDRDRFLEAVNSS